MYTTSTHLAWNTLQRRTYKLDKCVSEYVESTTTIWHHMLTRQAKSLVSSQGILAGFGPSMENTHWATFEFGGFLKSFVWLYLSSPASIHEAL